MNNFFEELKRRNVIKAAIAYVVVAWVVLQVIDMFTDLIEAPLWVAKLLTALIFLGFPIWIVFSWVFEATAEGVKRTSEVQPGESMNHVINKRLNILIVIMLVVAVAVNLLMGNSALDTVNDDEVESSGSAAIAVLPFDNESPGEDSEWLSKGMTTDVQSNLARLPELTVISNTSAARYKQSDKSVPEIMQELKVNYVLEGDVSIYEGQIQINVQLIDSNDHPVWSEVFRENFKDIFSIRERIARAVADRLKVTLSPGQVRDLQKIPSENPRAIELFLRAKVLMEESKWGNNKEIEELLDEAIRLDPGYADAVAFKAWLLWRNIYLYDDNRFEEMERLCEESLELDPENVIGLTVMASIYFYEGDLEETKNWLNKALQSEPSNSFIHDIMFEYYSLPEDEDLGLALYHIKKAHELDPFNQNYKISYYAMLNANGRFEEAKKLLEGEIVFNEEEDQVLTQAYWRGIAAKDQTLFLKTVNEKLKQEPNNADYKSALAWYYDAVYNDNGLYARYSQEAFELEPSRENFREYAHALSENGMYEQALNLLDSLWGKYYKEAETIKKYALSNFYYETGDFEKAGQYLDSIPVIYGAEGRRIRIHAQLGEVEKAKEIYTSKKVIISTDDRALYYAILGERDSMYYYMERPTTLAIYLNSRFEMDPYRNEERYKDYLRKNGLPVPGEYDPSELEIKQPRTIEEEAKE